MMRALVIPSDSLEAYNRAGYLSKILESSYFNPANAFDEVVIASPLEPDGVRYVGPYRVMGVPSKGFASLVKRIRPDIIRAYGAFWACDLAVYQSNNIPVFVSVHDTNPRLFHRSLQFADTVMCVSEAVRKQSLRHGVPEHKCHVVGNWVDFSQFYPCPEASRVTELHEKYPDIIPILHVGRKTFQKNLDTLINALPMLPENVHVFFIGRGDVQEYIQLARVVGVEHRCHWIDMVPNEELKFWFSWCRCMCTPSRWEGFGIVFIEASACGAPIVTSNVAPMNEFLVNRKNALLVDMYESPHHLAQCISEIVFNDDMASKLGGSASIMAKDKFDRVVVQQEEARLMLATIENFDQNLHDSFGFKIEKNVAKACNDVYFSLRSMRDMLRRKLL